MNSNGTKTQKLMIFKRDIVDFVLGSFPADTWCAAGPAVLVWSGGRSRRLLESCVPALALRRRVLGLPVGSTGVWQPEDLDSSRRAGHRPGSRRASARKRFYLRRT
jgi:hypothetical protein